MTALTAHQTRCLANARQRTAELADLKTSQMSQDDLLIWLTRMEIAARDLLTIVDSETRA